MAKRHSSSPPPLTDPTINPHHYKVSGNDDEFDPFSSSPTPNLEDDDDETKTSLTLQATCADVYLKEIGEIEERWIVEDFLPSGWMLVWTGNSKAGKSTMATALSIAVANGEDFAGMKTTKSNVLWIAYEENQLERAQILSLFSDLPHNLFIMHDKPLINRKRDLAALGHYILENDIKLVVVDPLYAATDAVSLSGGREARSVLAPLKSLCGELDVSVILIHHFTKDVSKGHSRERSADSAQIIATASSDAMMEVQHNGDGSREITLHCSGRGKFANCQIVVRSDNETDYKQIRRGPPGVSGADMMVLELLPFLAADKSKSYTAAELADEFDMDAQTMRNKLTVLRKEKKIKLKDGKRPYRYQAI